MGIEEIKEYLKTNDPTYLGLLNQPDIGVIQLADDANFRRILNDSTSEKSNPGPSTTEPEPSTSGNSMPNRYVEETFFSGFTTRCPSCLNDFKNYKQHKNHKVDSGCCLCKTKFDSDDELREHVQNYPDKFVCCLCKKEQTKHDYKQYYAHVKHCYRKHKSQQQTN